MKRFILLFISSEYTNLLLFSRNNDIDILGIVPPPVTPDFPILSLCKNDAGDKPDTAAGVECRLFPISSAGLIKLECKNHEL